jgi:RNA polymerase sigma factor (TIGR02999 family)
MSSTGTSSRSVTRFLKAWGGGDDAALERLAPAVYDELRRIAASHMRRERSDHTLQPTALVNQAWVRLLDGARLRWADRNHFFAVASTIMRRVLVDAARARLTGKRCTGLHRVRLHESLDAAPPQDAALVALDDALDALACFDPRKARVVEMKFFGGIGAAEIAASLGVSEQTVLRDWKLARAWLQREMKREG